MNQKCGFNWIFCEFFLKDQICRLLNIINPCSRLCCLFCFVFFFFTKAFVMNLVNQGSWYNIGMHLNYDIIRDGSVFHVRLGPDVQLSLTEVLSPGQWQVGCPCWKWGRAQWHVPSPMCCCNKMLQSGGLNGSGDQKSKIKVPSGVISGENSPPGLWKATFSSLPSYRGWGLFLSS